MSSELGIIDKFSGFHTELGDCPNIETATRGGTLMWQTMKYQNGWKLQNNYLTGLSRILDENNIRKAWGSPEVMTEKFKRLTRKEFLEPGDVVGVTRKKALGIYEHYAVYIGDGQVVHYSGENFDFNDSVCIRKDTLKNFLKNDNEYFVLYFDSKISFPRKIQVKTSFNFNDVNPDYRLHLTKDKWTRLYSAQETVERALSRLGEKNYNLLLNNCEHFAIWCKTGVQESYQVKRAVNILINMHRLDGRI